MKRAQIEAFFTILRDLDPEPQSELDYGSDYQLLVAVLLSAQATDAGVNRATAPLFERVKTPQDMLALGEEGLKTYIRTIGLFNTKAANTIAMSAALLADHGGKVPTDRDALQRLPGVGRKTANVVMNCAFGAETFAVDTHVFRVANRTGLAPGKDVVAVEAALEQRVPKPFRRDAHHWLILLGRYTCKARLPECWRCPVVAQCDYKAKVLSPPARRLPKRSDASVGPTDSLASDGQNDLSDM